MKRPIITILILGNLEMDLLLRPNAYDFTYDVWQNYSVYEGPSSSPPSFDGVRILTSRLTTDAVIILEHGEGKGLLRAKHIAPHTRKRVIVTRPRYQPELFAEDAQYREFGITHFCDPHGLRLKMAEMFGVDPDALPIAGS